MPIVALTGHSTGGLIERAIEAGAVGHVLKPFHGSQLVGAITTALADHAALADHGAREAVFDEFAEPEHRRDLILIESMVSHGHTEWEIAAALRERRRG